MNKEIKKILIALMAVIMVVSFVGCGGSQTPTTTQTPTAAEDNQPQGSASNPSTDNDEDTESKKVALGDIISLDFVEITLEQIVISSELKFELKEGNSSISTSVQPIEGTQFVYLTGSIKNLGKEKSAQYCMSANLSINGESYNAFQYLVDVEKAETYDALEAQDSATYCLYAQVPNDVTSDITSCIFEFGFNNALTDVFAMDVSELDNQYILSSADFSDSINTPLNQSDASKVQIIALGDTIITNEYEFTLNKIEFSYEILPEKTNRVYTSYPAEKGKVYIHIDGQLKNLMKRDIRIDELFTPFAVYDDGYVYNGFVIVNDGDNSFDWVGSYSAASPLATCHVHGLIEVPIDLEESDKTLIVSVKLSDGISYQFNYR